MRELYAGELAEILAGEMLRTADTDRSEIESGMSFAVSDQILQAADRQSVRCHDYDCERGKWRDRLEILRRVVVELLVQCNVSGDRSRAAAEDRVAVRRSALDVGGADIAASPGAVLDADRLAAKIRHFVERQAAGDVG